MRMCSFWLIARVTDSTTLHPLDKWAIVARHAHASAKVESTMLRHLAHDQHAALLEQLVLELAISGIVDGETSRMVEGVFHTRCAELLYARAVPVEEHIVIVRFAAFGLSRPFIDQATQALHHEGLPYTVWTASDVERARAEMRVVRLPG
jgi:hypothetical protein